jgi:hypothetical protein
LDTTEMISAPNLALQGPSSPTPAEDIGANAVIGQNPLECFRIRVADRPRERALASELLQRMYATRGYQCKELTETQRDSSKTIMAMDGDMSIGTLTVGLDVAGRLNVDELFHSEVQKVRDSGRKVCEFTRLAMDRTATRSPRLLAGLFHVAYIFARKVKCRDVVFIEVNPRHVRYYELMLGFKVLSEPKQNPRVEAPAVLLMLDLAHADKQIGIFGGQPELAATERSAYPHFFSKRMEDGIELRLLGEEYELAEVLKALDRRHIPCASVDVVH